MFGPATTTRHVYDVAAQHVVSGAMQGINGMSALLLILVQVLLTNYETGNCYCMPIRSLSGAEF